MLGDAKTAVSGHERVVVTTRKINHLNLHYFFPEVIMTGGTLIESYHYFKMMSFSHCITKRFLLSYKSGASRLKRAILLKLFC
jgi:hypothetical protein